MGKLVVFEIGEGNFEKGFPVKIRISEQGEPHFAEIAGRLPTNLGIPQSYYEWQSVYKNLPANWLISIPENQITNVSTIEHCRYTAEKFQASFNEWLNQKEVREMERQLLQKVGDWQNVRFILQTQDSLLRRLPWHLWDVFHTSDTQPEVIISSEYEPSRKQLKTPVKILAVLGHSQGINVKADLKSLEEKLPGAMIKPLIEPSRSQLMDELWYQSWDILFFAGHSCSQEGDSWGVIEINRNESVSLKRLRHSLRHAVEKGLKLAIFNSCDGLGLARNLADLRIPYTIVMREPVPDIVAQHFLQYFLTSFAAGESLYTAVQQARLRLQEQLEDDYPCASWLPVIFQNPAARELKYPSKVNLIRNRLTLASVTIVFSCLSIYLLWIKLKDIQLNQRFSQGERILVKAVTSLDKEDGVREFSSGNYKEAVDKFASSLRQNRNDPETRIYLNNSIIGNKSSLLIGVPVPIGNNPAVAQEILRGVAQAQEQINTGGGINHQLLKVEIANDDNNPEKTPEIAEKFAENSNILAVVGHDSSDASSSASKIYQARKLVMISPASTSESLYQQNNHEAGENYIFGTSVTSSTIANNLANYAKKVGMNKIGICDDSQAKEQSFNSDFEQAIGHFIQINCDLVNPNLQPPDQVIQEALNKKVDAILLNPQVDRRDKALKIAVANRGKLRLLGNASLETEETLKNGHVMKGMVLAVPWDASTTNGKRFVEDAEKIWGDQNSITWRTANAFDATKAIAVAIKEKSASRRGIQQAFSNEFSYSGATGELRFSSHGDRTGNAVLLQVQSDATNPLGYSFAPLNSIESRISLGQQILVKDKHNTSILRL